MRGTPVNGKGCAHSRLLTRRNSAFSIQLISAGVIVRTLVGGFSRRHDDSPSRHRGADVRPGISALEMKLLSRKNRLELTSDKIHSVSLKVQASVNRAPFPIHSRDSCPLIVVQTTERTR